MNEGEQRGSLILPSSHNIVLTSHFSQELRKMVRVLGFHKNIYLNKCLLGIFVLELVFFFFFLYNKMKEQ